MSFEISIHIAKKLLAPVLEIRIRIRVFLQGFRSAEDQQ